MYMADFSQALAQYTTQCVGIDLSENMAGAYNARAENQVSCDLSFLRWANHSHETTPE
jgi:hypothetical protein